MPQVFRLIATLDVDPGDDFEREEIFFRLEIYRLDASTTYRCRLWSAELFQMQEVSSSGSQKIFDEVLLRSWVTSTSGILASTPFSAASDEAAVDEATEALKDLLQQPSC